jgi:hypothetical protein
MKKRGRRPPKAAGQRAAVRSGRNDVVRREMRLQNERRILRARSPRMRITRGGGGLSLSGQDSYNSMFRFPKRNPAAARRWLRRHTP